MNKSDVVIIGAGPVGLFTAFQCGMLRLSCQLIDALETIGGQCAALYPEKPIYDIPAYPSITGGELVEQLAKQMAPFSPVIHLNQQVTGFEKVGDCFQLTTSTGNKLECGAVIIAAGAGAFGPNRPPLKGLEAFEKTGCVQYCVRKKAAYNGKHIVIAGGGDSAVDWALTLADNAASVAVVHRRAKFRAAPDSIEKMHNHSNIEVITPYQLDNLKGDNGELSAVSIHSHELGERILQADVLLPFFGLSMDLGAIQEWGLGLEKSHIQTMQHNMQTTIDGIYAVGDVATYTGKLKLISVGFAEAAAACHDAWKRLNPDQAFHFEYSTTKGVNHVAA